MWFRKCEIGAWASVRRIEGEEPEGYGGECSVVIFGDCLIGDRQSAGSQETAGFRRGNIKSVSRPNVCGGDVMNTQNPSLMTLESVMKKGGVEIEQKRK